jgi:hypothetical protein
VGIQRMSRGRGFDSQKPDTELMHLVLFGSCKSLVVGVKGVCGVDTIVEQEKWITVQACQGIPQCSRGK